VQDVVWHAVAEATRGPVLIEDRILGADRVDLAQPLDRDPKAVVQRDWSDLALGVLGVEVVLLETLAVD
jgi:hypothetical protein